MPAALAVGAVVGAVGSGYMAKRASDKATNASSAASDNALDLQYKMWREQQDILQPWVDSGEQGLNYLNYAMYGTLPEDGSLTASDMDSAGVSANSLLDDGYTMEDWYASPEYQVYNNAQGAALTNATDTINAQNAARGMFGSGTWANQLNTNMGNIYAAYQPASLAAAQASDTTQRMNNYNMMSGLSNLTGATQLANAASQYGVNSGNLTTAAGNAQAQGQLTGANAMIGGVTSGLNQVANAYGNYSGQQNINALLAALAAKTGTSSYNPYGQVNNSGWAFNL